MKKLAILLLFLYSLSLFGCAAPTKPTEPSIETIDDDGCHVELRIENKEAFYEWYEREKNNANNPPPGNMILFNDVESLAWVDMFCRPFCSSKDNHYYYYELVFYLPGTLYCYHDGAKNVDSKEDPSIAFYEPASISSEMTDMTKIPVKDNKKQIITRNGFHYLYKADGNIEAIEWHIDTIRLRLVIDIAEYMAKEFAALVSVDDDVAFAAMDEIVDRLSNRQPVEICYRERAFNSHMKAIDADSRRDKRPKNMVTWDNVQSDLFYFVTDFTFLNEELTHYRYGIQSMVFEGSFEFVHGESEAGEGTVSGYKPVPISNEMTDMLHIPNAEERYVISRNGIEYYYNEAGNLETVKWEHDWKYGLITCRLNIDSIYQGYLDENELHGIDDIIQHMNKQSDVAFLKLLSISDDVVFDALDEIQDRMKVRDLYVPQETTAKSTPAQ